MIRRTITLTPADKRAAPYAYIPFDVPEGTTRLDVTMRYPKADDCVIDLGCADPRLDPFPSGEVGFRGWSGGARDGFFVARDDATPGYVPGEMPAGEWRVILGLYRVPKAGCEVSMEITLDDAPRDLWTMPGAPTPVREGAGWYRGDLHCHTFHSDAAGSPETLHAAALQAGLDFLAVADHNTVTARRYFHPASSPELVFVRGMEATTEHGHCNAFGIDQWVDFRMERGSDAHAVAEAVHRHGGLLSINHDKPAHPWLHDWPEADLMEVWQHPWLAWNWISLERWQTRLAAGLRLPMIGGSDWHQPAELKPEGPFTLARPTTVLWCEALSEAEVLAAMKAGRGYVTEAPGGPHLDLRLGGAPMGGTGTGRAEIETRGAAGDVLSLWDATGEIARLEIADDGIAAPDLAPQGFLRAEIHARASRDRLLAEFRAAFPEGLPWSLSEDIIAAQHLRRALSNPVWTK